MGIIYVDNLCITRNKGDTAAYLRGFVSLSHEASRSKMLYRGSFKLTIDLIEMLYLVLE